MTVSVRSYLTAGLAAVAASAVAVAPVHVPAPASITSDAVRLSAAVQPLLEPANAAAAVLGLVSKPAPAPAKPAAAAGSTATPQAAATANATGDWVANAWNFADYWINYAADLTQYVLGWVWPLNYIGDQAPILWDNLGSPIGDATVYGLIIPVLNDPLNWAVWSAGLSIVARTTVTALINTGRAEFNYFLGWLIPPLPPLPIPPLPIAATAPLSAPAAAATALTDLEAPLRTVATKPLRRLADVARKVALTSEAVVATTPTVAEPAAAVAADPVDVTVDPQDPAADVADTPKTVQDAVKDTAKPVRDTAKKARSTVGAARDHSEKKRAAHGSGE